MDLIENDDAVEMGGRSYWLYRMEVQIGIMRAFSTANVRLKSIRHVHPKDIADEGISYASEIREETWTVNGEEKLVLVAGSHKDPRIAVITRRGIVTNVVRASPAWIERCRDFGLEGVVLTDSKMTVRIGDFYDQNTKTFIKIVSNKEQKAA